MAHALVRPLLERLVLKTASGMGYPAKGGTALKNWAGKTIPLKANDDWTIAHPLDFAAAGDWHEWQAECFRGERLQPFKQVFREVYVLTAAEKEDGDKSRRYSGQQINENQAKAIFSTPAGPRATTSASFTGTRTWSSMSRWIMATPHRAMPRCRPCAKPSFTVAATGNGCR